MKKPEDMTPEQLVRWLKKTRASISHRPYSVQMNSTRGYALLDRYEALRDQAMNSGIWYDWCVHNGLEASHDGYDLFA